MHQFVATVAVAFTAPLAVEVLADFLSPFDWVISSSGQILTQTPYFPIQIVLALFSGWTLGRWVPHRSMFWVWILPFAALFMAFMLYPTYQPFVIGQFRHLSTASAFSHFFGRGCEVRNYCFDQLYLTMPFYTASAYSLASWFARRMTVRGGFDHPVRVINPWRAFLVSSIVILCITLFSGSNIFSENGLSLVSKVAILVMITVVEAAAATLLIVVGSRLVPRKSLSKALFFKARD